MKRTSEAGFTLISVIMAVVILSIGIMALGRSQAMLVRAQATSASRDVALGIARNYVEEVRSRTTQPASEGATAVDETGTASAGGHYSRSLTVSDLGDGLYQAICSVTYPRGQQPVQIITLIYR
ncbi:MAG TPA: prepilin-type N-terminal cleavage/methylation domain-containing protein [Gemmatimonadales bacterium]|nr:prepilin-type N-terminal cleavage/methylation domain-containing protein [Gemmatimonadales bacterium]